MNIYEEQKVSRQNKSRLQNKDQNLLSSGTKLTTKEIKFLATEHIKTVYEKQKLVHGTNHDYKEGTKFYRPSNKPRL
jgi:hypothetical protein